MSIQRYRLLNPTATGNEDAAVAYRFKSSKFWTMTQTRVFLRFFFQQLSITVTVKTAQYDLWSDVREPNYLSWLSTDCQFISILQPECKEPVLL